jgi:hypothetical protein
MLSTDSLVRELFLVCQLAIGYQLAKNQLASNQAVTIGPKFPSHPAYCRSYLKIFRRSGLSPVQSYLPIGANLPIGQLAANRQLDKKCQLAEICQLDQFISTHFYA